MPEADLLTAPGIAIVLAEPGAGKTDLLDSVADRLGAAHVRASIVRPSDRDTTLIVDAFDEVARIGDARVYDILYKIRDAEPDRVLLSSRSGEWEVSRTRLIRDLFRKEPQVAHLVPLDGGEQRQLFEHLHPQRSFDEFHANISRFDLHHILGNPEFLRLFASAYDEADGRLRSRGDVFTLAIENLARESNSGVLSKGAPARHKRITWAKEVFSKGLLSGVDGVAMGDIAEDDLHPQMETIGLAGDPTGAQPVVERLLAEEISAPSHNDLRSIRADLRRKAAMMSSRPGPVDVATSLDGGPPASVEQLRALMLGLFDELQSDIRAGDSGLIDLFYNGKERRNEVGAMFRVAAWLKPRLHPFDIHDIVEHRLGARNRCDLTATRMVRGQARMLVIEGKGQWHRDLIPAASPQLSDRYSVHQHADEQGIVFVVWYGSE